MLSRKVGKNYQYMLRKMPKESKSRFATCFIVAWDYNISSWLYTSQFFTPSFSKTLESVQSVSGCYVLFLSQAFIINNYFAVMSQHFRRVCKIAKSDY